ncbi:MAG: dihydrofolate reductase, partial [Micrococcales bacterium]|nr:dihydrofolate reductase [Micrococcales bacterium]
MTRFIYDTATSFTGFIADSDHSLQWLFDVPGGTEPDPELLPPTDALIVEGSSTYEWLLRESDLVDHPEKWQELFGARRTFVFTTRNLPVPQGADVTFVSGPVSAVLSEIREAAEESDVWIV